MLELGIQSVQTVHARGIQLVPKLFLLLSDTLYKLYSVNSDQTAVSAPSTRSSLIWVYSIFCSISVGVFRVCSIFIIYLLYSNMFETTYLTDGGNKYIWWVVYNTECGMHKQGVCFPNVEQWILDSCALGNVFKLLMLYEVWMDGQLNNLIYSKTCEKRPLRNRQIKILMTKGSLMKVKSIVECSPWSILLYHWPALINNWSLKPIFGLFESGHFTQVLLYC